MATGNSENVLGTKGNPYREEEAPPKSGEEGDVKETVDVSSEKPHIQPLMNPAVIIPVAEFALTLLEKILDGILAVPRKIAIGLKNYTSYKLRLNSVYYSSGTTDNPPPNELPSQMAGLWGARKTESTARGTVGVVAFDIVNQSKTLLIMWSVPFDYNLYSNWWSAVVVSGSRKADSGTYSDMYNGYNGMPYPWQANGWKTRSSNGFELLGSMTNNGQSLLEIELK